MFITQHTKKGLKPILYMALQAFTAKLKNKYNNFNKIIINLIQKTYLQLVLKFFL